MSQFSPIHGNIFSITPVDRTNGCALMFSVTSQEFGPVNLMVTQETYVLEQETFKPGDSITAFYDKNTPVPLIYPPQYQAAVILENDDNAFADFGYYDNNLVNTGQTLKLNLSSQPSDRILLANGQVFTGNPGGHYLLVIYDKATLSIPAQTNPLEVIVFC